MSRRVDSHELGPGLVVKVGDEIELSCRRGEFKVQAIEPKGAGCFLIVGGPDLRGKGAGRDKGGQAVWIGRKSFVQKTRDGVFVHHPANVIQVLRSPPRKSKGAVPRVLLAGSLTDVSGGNRLASRGDGLPAIPAAASGDPCASEASGKGSEQAARDCKQKTEQATPAAASGDPRGSEAIGEGSE